MTCLRHPTLRCSLGFALCVCLWATPVFASLCLEIKDIEARSKLLPVAAGNQLRLQFKHSIYGSAVDEILVVRAHGFELTELRYGEARLVEFYGHAQARRENDAWVVRPEQVIFPVLNLRVSDAAEMKLSVHTPAKLVTLHLPAGSALRVGVFSCKQRANG